MCQCDGSAYIVVGVAKTSVGWFESYVKKMGLEHALIEGREGATRFYIYNPYPLDAEYLLRRYPLDFTYAHNGRSMELESDLPYV